MRTFIAIDIPINQLIKSLYSDLQSHLNGLEIKFTAPDQNHLTLAFFGETETMQVNKVKNDLKKVTGNFRPFDLQLKSLGSFNKSSKPGVLWIGVNHSNELETLWTTINAMTQDVGFKNKTNSFKPHLTVGRIKQINLGNNLFHFLEKYKNWDFGKTSVREIVYYQSILKPDGPEYKSLLTVSL